MAFHCNSMFDYNIRIQYLDFCEKRITNLITIINILLIIYYLFAMYIFKYV